MFLILFLKQESRSGIHCEALFVLYTAVQKYYNFIGGFYYDFGFKKNTSDTQVENLVKWFDDKNRIPSKQGKFQTVLSLVGTPLPLTFL